MKNMMRANKAIEICMSGSVSREKMRHFNLNYYKSDFDLCFVCFFNNYMSLIFVTQKKKQF